MEIKSRGLNLLFHKNKILFLTVLLIFAVLPAFSDETFFQKIEWKSNANALEYKVEIQNVASGKSQFITTDKNSTEISLVPGKYRYRVFAYDFLGKEASVSSWTNFDVFKASKPKITDVEKKVKIPKDSDSISINVDISDVNADSKFELVNESLQGAVDASEKSTLRTGSETDSVTKLDFKDVPPGKWRLKVTNASGLSSLSDVIEIDGGKMAGITDEELQKIKEQAEKDKNAALAEAEKNFDEERKAFEEERKRFEAESKRFEEERKIFDEKARAEEEKRLAKEKAEEEKRLAREKAEAEKKAIEDAKRKLEEDKRLAREAEKRAKEEWKKAHPYVYKDVIFDVGLGLSLATYDGTVKKYTDESATVGLNARLAWLFKKTASNKFGAELSLSNRTFKKESEAYNLSLDFTSFDLRAVWQHKLTNKIFVAVKGGIGLTDIEKEILYNYTSTLRTAPGSKDYVYPDFSLGASIFFNPWKFLVFEAGVDYNHVMAAGMTTGFVTPYASVGFRF